jgi:NAD(P)-dependent dehydrogenase (short-subunit alcohol dehydrogenase family)
MATTPGEAHVDLTGQVALVTGGGRGLGRAFVLALAAAGAKVAVMARTAAQLAETVQLIERAGGCALASAGGVSVPDAVAHVVTTTEQQLGSVDILVNNAGWHVPESLGYNWEVEPEGWWHTFEINLQGPFLCARAVLPGMIQSKRGRTSMSPATPRSRRGH